MVMKRCDCRYRTLATFKKGGDGQTYCVVEMYDLRPDKVECLLEFIVHHRVGMIRIGDLSILWCDADPRHSDSIKSFGPDVMPWNVGKVFAAKHKNLMAEVDETASLPVGYEFSSSYEVRWIA